VEHYVGQYLEDTHSYKIIKVISLNGDSNSFTGIIIDIKKDDRYHDLEQTSIGWVKGHNSWKDVTQKYASPLWKVLNG
jgi:hypothetical protein